MVSDAVLTKLRAEVMLQAAHENAKPEWRQLADALAELEERRAEEQIQETTT